MGMHGAISSNKALIGGIPTGLTRFLEYIDGSIMTDGHFADASNTWIGDVLTSSGNSKHDCFVINQEGIVERCTKKCLSLEGAPMKCEEVICEKSLVPKDKSLCVDKSNTVPSKITLDDSFDITIPVSIFRIDKTRTLRNTFHSLLLMFIVWFHNNRNTS